MFGGGRLVEENGGELRFKVGNNNEPLSRAAALGAAAIMLCMIGDLVRRKAFAPLLLIEIRYFPENDHSAVVSVAFNGDVIDSVPSIRHVDGTERKLSSDGSLKDFRDCHSINFDLPKGVTSRLQINAHRISEDFEAEPLNGWLSYLPGDSEERPGKLDSVSGLTRIAVSTTQRRVTVRLSCT